MATKDSKFSILKAMDKNQDAAFEIINFRILFHEMGSEMS